MLFDRSFVETFSLYVHFAMPNLDVGNLLPLSVNTRKWNGVTPQQMSSITVNGRKATNVTAAVFYRI